MMSLIKKWVKKIWPVVITLLILIFLIRNCGIENIKIDRFYWPPVLLVLTSILIAYGFRAYAYQKLLIDRQLVPIDLLFKITGVYNFLSSLFPFGTGHLTYPIFIKKYTKLSFASSLNSLFLYNLVRAVFFVVLFCLMVFHFELETFFISLHNLYETKKGIMFFTLFLMVLFCFFVLIKLVNNQKINSEWLQKLRSIVQINIKVILLVILVSTFVIIFNVMNLYFSYLVFGTKLSLSAVIFLLALTNLSSFFPIHAASSIGSYELINTFGMILLGFESELAIQLSFAVHLLGLLLQGIVALLCYKLLKMNKSFSANV